MERATERADLAMALTPCRSPRSEATQQAAFVPVGVWVDVSAGGCRHLRVLSYGPRPRHRPMIHARTGASKRPDVREMEENGGHGAKEPDGNCLNNSEADDSVSPLNRDGDHASTTALDSAKDLILRRNVSARPT